MQLIRFLCMHIAHRFVDRSPRPQTPTCKSILPKGRTIARGSTFSRVLLSPQPRTNLSRSFLSRDCIREKLVGMLHPAPPRNCIMYKGSRIVTTELILFVRETFSFSTDSAFLSFSSIYLTRLQSRPIVRLNLTLLCSLKLFPSLRSIETNNQDFSSSDSSIL